MAKWLIGVFLIVSAVAGLWWLQPFGGSRATENPYLQHVPADTVFYLGGRSDQELADFIGAYSFNLYPSQATLLNQLMENITASDSPAAKFSYSLFQQFMQVSGGNLAAMAEQMGLAINGGYAFYLHGIVPVLKMTLSEPAKMLAMLDQASRESGWQYQLETIDTTELRLWKISPDDTDLAVSLAIAIDGNVLTATLLAGNDSAADREERIGQRLPENPLTAAIAELRKQYQLEPLTVGVFNIEGLVQGYLTPESNRLGRDLLRYIPAASRAEFFPEIDENCRGDALTLAASVPRAVIGYTDLRIENNQLQAENLWVLELLNDELKQTLASLRGYLPAYTQTAEDKLFSVSFGSDIDTIIPGVTALWSQFLAASFSCEALIEAQNNLRNQNPETALVGMNGVRGFGLKGFGTALYDVVLGDAFLPETISAIASISVDNPMVIASFINLIPDTYLPGLTIPSDGTPVPVNIPMLPETIKPLVAIKGQHLVIYAGQEGAAAAEKLSNEALAANGFYGLTANYKNIAGVLERELDKVQLPESACISGYEMKHYFSIINSSVAAVVDVETAGLTVRSRLTMQPSTVPTLDNLVGEYNTFTYLENCQAEVDGVEVFNADGTGSANSQDPSSACTNWENEYRWTRTGNIIEFNTTVDRYRDDCDSPWEITENVPAERCMIINIGENEFQCLYGIFGQQENEEPFLVKYQRR